MGVPAAEIAQSLGLPVIDGDHAVVVFEEWFRTVGMRVRHTSKPRGQDRSIGRNE